MDAIIAAAELAERTYAEHWLSPMIAVTYRNALRSPSRSAMRDYLTMHFDDIEEMLGCVPTIQT